MNATLEMYMRMPFGTMLTGDYPDIIRPVRCILNGFLVEWFDTSALTERTEKMANLKMILFPRECIAKTIFIENIRVCPLMEYAYLVHKDTFGRLPEKSRIYQDKGDMTIVTKGEDGGKSIVTASALAACKGGLKDSLFLMRYHIDFMGRIAEGTAVSAVDWYNPY